MSQPVVVGSGEFVLLMEAKHVLRLNVLTAGDFSKQSLNKRGNSKCTHL